MTSPSAVRRLRDLLDEHQGREHAITLADMGRELGWSRREVELTLNALRAKHGVYCACGQGVFRAATRQELTNYRLSLKGRLEAQEATLRAVERELSGPGQMALLEA